MGVGIDLRIQPCKCETNRLGVDAQADFALAFAMVHVVRAGSWFSGMGFPIRAGGYSMLSPQCSIDAR